MHNRARFDSEYGPDEDDDPSGATERPADYNVSPPSVLYIVLTSNKDSFVLLVVVIQFVVVVFVFSFNHR